MFFLLQTVFLLGLFPEKRTSRLKCKLTKFWISKTSRFASYLYIFLIWTTLNECKLESINNMMILSFQSDTPKLSTIPYSLHHCKVFINLNWNVTLVYDHSIRSSLAGMFPLHKTDTRVTRKEYLFVIFVLSNIYKMLMCFFCLLFLILLYCMWCRQSDIVLLYHSKCL